MNFNEKEQKIIDMLKKQDYIDNVTLSSSLGCSLVTVRSTVTNLEKKGMLLRTHGGVKNPTSSISVMLKSGNIFKSHKDKIRIAEKAYKEIDDRDTIILDDSSNSFYLATIIKKYDKKDITVITTSLVAAAELSHCHTVTVIMIGGLLSGSPSSTMGDYATEMLAKFKANKAFIGVHGINPEVGITSIGNSQMQIKKLIFEITQKVFVLACSNKFSHSHLLVSTPISSIYKVITDKKLLPEYKRELQNKTFIETV
ncbi:DeoR/GlpR family DNA-binding transcription regulator [Conservatibacter flavescens]|uniref:DeoR/GlpR transcriptional regulator n=1 Tax=Conservatibacter flavescens TaxID=28161 RepID=A0A2M8RZZ5_9PAST|nr:DeoR/GlpR family DNA-binding transcription regulator [Conservatibacter flavescens]PJG84455.1 DeoR/GlpR transcriptional regulator [Conservatibacter flavescens]